MARLVLTVLALVFISCVVADSDSPESENLRQRRRWNDASDSDEENSSEEESYNISGIEAEPRKIRVKLPSGKTAYIKNSADKTRRRSHRRSKTSLLALDPSDDEYKLMENEMQSTILEQSNSSLHFSKYNILKGGSANTETENSDHQTTLLLLWSQPQKTQKKSAVPYKTAIEKVVSVRLMKRYKRRQANIKSEIQYVNERMLYFESSKADAVIYNGFNEIHANTSGRYGPGLYFTKYSSIANQYATKDSHCIACERKILVTRVTLGKIYKINPDNNPISHPPAGYYSVEGEASQEGMKYDEYIIFRGEQAYPDYLITYCLIP